MEISESVINGGIVRDYTGISCIKMLYEGGWRKNGDAREPCRR